jgi:hypothetical protein
MSGRWALFESVPGPVTYHPAEGHLDRWWLVRTPRFGVYVQRINGAMDSGPSFHTHPRPRITLVVRGGYDEKIERHYPSGLVRFGERTRRTGSVHRMRTIDAHTITGLRRCPTWTVVLVGRRRPEPSWGYWDNCDFTPWNEHPARAQIASVLHARDATIAQDRSPAGAESRPAQPRPVDTGRRVENVATPGGGRVVTAAGTVAALVALGGVIVRVGRRALLRYGGTDMYAGWSATGPPIRQALGRTT